MNNPPLIGDLLRAAAARHPDREAYVHNGERVTYQWLDAAADGFAATLQQSGVVAGNIVSLLLPSSINFAACYLGALRVGAITSAINLRLGPREKSSIFTRAQPVLTVLNDKSDLPTGVVAHQILTTGDLKDAFATPPRQDFPVLSPDQSTCIVWTSGTTGEPKGAVYDHQTQAAISRNIGELTQPGDRRLVVLPFAHVGYMTRMWDELANMTTIVLAAEPWSPTETLRIIREESITMATGVPTQWQLLLEHPDLALTDFSAVRIAGIGAAAIPPELIERLRITLGCPFVTRYTSTEAGLTTSTRTTDTAEVIANTVGQPATEVELKLIDLESGASCQQDEVGEVICRSPAMMRGYWKNPELTATVIDEDGWLHTGDLGYLRADKNLVLVGRAKEMYIRGGYNIYPVEIEAVLNEHPVISRAAVVGREDSLLGEVGVAYLVLKPEKTITLDEVQRWCAEQLADYKKPDQIVVLTELPLTPMLKVDKQSLIRDYET